MRRSLTLLVLTGTLIAAEAIKEMIPMRDGIRLSATVTLPVGPGPFPTILTRTPYAIQSGPNQFVAAGYAVVQQNLRGLFESEGKWPMFASEIVDGFDTVEWVARQPWSNGKVGVLGGSGPGIAGYMTLMSGAPHLSAGVIQNAHANTYPTVAYPGGVYQSQLVDSWTKARGAEVPAPFPRPIFRKHDQDFERQDIRSHAANVKVPILHYTGWFDVFTQGTIDYFQFAQTKGTDKARGNQKLVIHPKGHGGRLLGELQWNPETPAFDGLARRWFDYWLRGIDTGVHKLPAVQYYALGDPRTAAPPANTWRSGAGWPPAHKPEAFFLQPGGGLSRATPTQAGSSSSFDYDPANPVPTLSARASDWLNRPPLDQRPLKERADILRFNSLPLMEPVEIAGPIQAELFVSTSAKDTDFFVRVIDIHPDGFEALMISRPLRLRFRDGFEKMLPARKNNVYKINVNLWSLAMAFPKGHRIGVQVTSSEVPRFDRHSNTWDPVKSYDEAVKATNTVHHSTKYPSRLILPVVDTSR
ncbi:MAG: CocE/NonD family hydrolase [Bryobacteraceae bacterium]